MKYFVLLPDGAADYPIASLGNKTPFDVASLPTMDYLASHAVAGMVSNVPEGMVPESDTANLAVLSYDPKVYSKGRSPLEAVSMGIDMKSDETAYRCNVVNLGGCHALRIGEVVEQLWRHLVDTFVGTLCAENHRN